MKKTLLVCMLLIAIVLSFAACDGKDDPPSNDGGNNNETPVHTHNFGEWETTVKPTCAEDGTKVRYCSCGEKQSEVVVALGHTPSEAVVEDKVEPTYEADGSYNEVVRCSTCNEKLSETSHTIPMLRHTPAEAVTENVVDATCYSEGSYDTVVYCADCNVELERTKHTVEKVAHSPANAVEENVVDSTCYSVGSKDMVVYCSVLECHAFIEKISVTIDKKAHSSSSAVEENRVEPTFEKAGSYQMVVYCSVAECHAELERTTHTLDMLVHHPGSVVIENKVAPTCTKTGSYDEVVYCLDENCGHKELSRKTISVPVIAHTSGTAVEENRVNATCYAEGSYDNVVYCSVCNTELSRTTVTLQKIDHSPASVIIENRVEASCTTDGSYDEVIYCSVENCKVEISRTTKIISALGHIEVVDEAVVPTCTNTGLTEGKHCSICNEVLVAQTTVNALGHTEVIDDAVEPTCTLTGLTEGKHCSVCEVVTVAQTVIDALGHQKLVVIPPKTLYTVANSTTYPFVVSENQITSSNKTNNSSSTYTIMSNQDFTLELQYKVSSEANYDKLIIKHNSTTKVNVSGTSTSTFTSISINMSAGDIVTITYSKDSSSSGGDDCAHVKFITENKFIGEERTELVRITADNITSLASCTEDVLCNDCGQVAINKIEHQYSNNICSVCGDNIRHFAGGNGTEVSPYLISTAKHLDNIRLYPSSHFELTNDIQFTSQDFSYSGNFYNSGNYWNPIDDFNGVLNGNNFSIDGLKINRNGGGKQISDVVWNSSSYFGLFSSTDGEISNITLLNVNIQIYINYAGTSNSNTTGAAYIGGIAGRANGKISNCTVNGKITATGQTNNVRAIVGGIVGYTYTDCSIENCVNYATINATCTKTVYNYGSGTYLSSSFVTVGGVVGEFQGTCVANCINYGTVTAISYDHLYAGGIIGECSDNMIGGQPESRISGCYNYGNVEVCSNPPSNIAPDYNSSYNNPKAGGIVGYVEGTEVFNCGNYANVTAKGWNAYAGGLIGCAYDDTIIRQCYNVGNVLAYDTDTSSKYLYGFQYAGGITADGGLIDQCYNAGEITATGKDYIKAAGITVCTFKKISNCYNTGSISTNLDARESKTAGIIVDCPTSIEYCYNIGELSGTKKAGIVCTVYDGTSNYDTERHVLYCYYLNNVTAGVYETLDYCTKLTYSKTDSQLRQQSTFANFDFNNIWKISDGEYPYPQLKNNTQTID